MVFTFHFRHPCLRFRDICWNHLPAITSFCFINLISYNKFRNLRHSHEEKEDDRMGSECDVCGEDTTRIVMCGRRQYGNLTSPYSSRIDKPKLKESMPTGTRLYPQHTSYMWYKNKKHENCVEWTNVLRISSTVPRLYTFECSQYYRIQCTQVHSHSAHITRGRTKEKKKTKTET